LAISSSSAPNRKLPLTTLEVKCMAKDKTASGADRVAELIADARSRVIAGRLTNWDLQRHLTRRPGDFCPFECGFCDEMRQFDEALKTALRISTSGS